MSAFGWIGAFVVLPWLLIGMIGARLPDSLMLLRHAPWQVWQLTPSVLVPLIVLMAIYLRGLRDSDGRVGQPSAARQWAFMGGLLAIFVALQSPVESLADHSLSIHQVEHMLLRSVGPALLLLARPQAVLMRGLPEWMRRGVVAPIAGSAGVRSIFGMLTRPIPVTLLFVAVTWFWMIPRYHDLALLNEPTHYTWHATLLLSGLLFFWRLFDPRPVPRGPSLAVRLLMVWGAEMGNILLGFLLTNKGHVIYPAYGKLGLLWGVSPLANEMYGGQTAWVVGTMMIAAAGMIVVYRWGLEEERTSLRGNPAAYAGVSALEYADRQRGRNRTLALGLVSFVGLIVAMMTISVAAYERSLPHPGQNVAASSDHLLP